MYESTAEKTHQWFYSAVPRALQPSSIPPSPHAPWLHPTLEYLATAWQSLELHRPRFEAWLLHASLSDLGLTLIFISALLSSQQQGLKKKKENIFMNF